MCDPLTSDKNEIARTEPRVQIQPFISWNWGGTGALLCFLTSLGVQVDEVNLIWIPATAIPPSPTAAAQRFTDPERTSPAAKIPGRLVSSGPG